MSDAEATARTAILKALTDDAVIAYALANAGIAERVLDRVVAALADPATQWAFRELVSSVEATPDRG